MTKLTKKELQMQLDEQFELGASLHKQIMTLLDGKIEGVGQLERILNRHPEAIRDWVKSGVPCTSGKVFIFNVHNFVLADVVTWLEERAKAAGKSQAEETIQILKTDVFNRDVRIAKDDKEIQSLKDAVSDRDKHIKSLQATLGQERGKRMNRYVDPAQLSTMTGWSPDWIKNKIGDFAYYSMPDCIADEIVRRYDEGFKKGKDAGKAEAEEAMSRSERAARLAADRAKLAIAEQDLADRQPVDDTTPALPDAVVDVLFDAGMHIDEQVAGLFDQLADEAAHEGAYEDPEALEDEVKELGILSSRIRAVLDEDFEHHTEARLARAREQAAASQARLDEANAKLAEDLAVEPAPYTKPKSRTWVSFADDIKVEAGTLMSIPNPSPRMVTVEIMGAKVHGTADDLAILMKAAVPAGQPTTTKAE